MKGRSDGEETKKRIVQNAAKLFVQKGYGAVTMNEVCVAAGVSKGSLYHHFPSKDELFLYVVEEDTELWLQNWDIKRAGIADLEERFYAYAEHCANDFQNPLIRALEEYARIKDHTAEIEERLWHMYDDSLRACRDLVKEGINTHYLKADEPEDIVVILSGLLEGVGKVSEISRSPMGIEEIKEYYRKSLRLLLQGIRT
ncbi:TetR/AcrR family transcriptional regulator [Paenibacillus sp. NPDC056722]|uniref:TetR/AcrR family transcriptional regulator n=1 Tax=Paenibacillus sp. NPDC056722 TaxID=3345924 RepID=UPI0036B59088